jgi:CheY-like chemotaxis protein
MPHRRVVLVDAESQVSRATSGLEALKVMEEDGEEPVMVVVVGSRLPDMSAREFVAHLEDDERLKGAQVVFCPPESPEPPG